MAMQKKAMHHGIELEDRLGYAQGVKSDGIIFVAAQLSMDEDGKVVGQGDFAEQLRQCYRNVKKVLSTYGVGMSYVMLETMYVKEGVSLEEMSEIRDEVYKDKKAIALTVVKVSGLVEEDLLVGVQCVAKVV